MIKQLWKFVITLVLSVMTMQCIAIEQVNVNSSGEASNDVADYPFYSLSGDGRYAVFSDRGSNLADNDENRFTDSFIRDRQTLTTELLGQQTNPATHIRGRYTSISADGRYVRYSFRDVVAIDLHTGEISKYDLSPIYFSGNLYFGIEDFDASGDGRFLTFNLDVTGCGEALPGCNASLYLTESYIYLHDQVTGETTSIRAVPDHTLSYKPKISANGRYVTFYSYSKNTQEGGFFVYDKLTGVVSPIFQAQSTDNINFPSEGQFRNGGISADGQYLSFSTTLGSLVSNDTNGGSDIFLYNQVTSVTSLISVASDGTHGNSSSTMTESSISADGRYIVFDSTSSNLIADDTNGISDIFIHDQVTGKTTLAVRNADGSQVNRNCERPTISADGVSVIFICYDTRLVNGNLISSPGERGLFIVPNELVKQREKDIPQDFNGDGSSDVLWRNTVTGENWIYLMDGGSILASESINTIDDLNWSVAGTGDFDGDGKADILWRNVESGENWIYLMDGTNVQTSQALDAVTNLDWEVQEVDDFDGDGKDDILWRHKQDGQVWMYLMDGINIAASQHVAYTGVDWDIKGVGDFDGDDKADILWRNNVHGRVWLYGMNGAAISASNHVAYTDPDHWEILGVGDHNGDIKADILWRNSTTGSDIVFLMNNHSILITKDTGYQIPAGGIDVKALGDYDGNGRIDLFMRGQTNGLNSLILSSGQNSFNYDSPILNTIDYDWEIQ